MRVLSNLAFLASLGFWRTLLYAVTGGLRSHIHPFGGVGDVMELRSATASEPQ